MKIQSFSFLFASVAALQAQPAINKAPIYEENFNSVTPRIEYVDGGGLGGPGTGVSGKLADRAYTAQLKTTENVSGGPAGVARSPIAPNPVSAFTCTFWYFLEEHTPDLQVLVETAGVGFFLHESGMEARVSNQPKMMQFVSGRRGPILDWTTPGRWIFTAMSWDAATNKVVVHQGTPDTPVSLSREMQRQAPATPTVPRTDLNKRPETIGNTFTKFDRPLAGRLDNLRFYDCVLDRDDLEQIRRADVENRPVSLK